jgi:hypothetical protein
MRTSSPCAAHSSDPSPRTTAAAESRSAGRRCCGLWPRGGPGHARTHACTGTHARTCTRAHARTRSTVWDLAG